MLETKITKDVMENTLVKSVCSYLSWNSIASDFSAIVAEFSSKNKKCIWSAEGQRFARVSARQMLSSCIISRVYSERFGFLGVLF